MLREIQTHAQKNYDTQYKAAVAMKTGMGVVLNSETMKAELPSAATAANVYFVTKERNVSGIQAAVVDALPDYDSNFNDIAADEFVKLQAPQNGEKFGTDQMDYVGLVANAPVVCGTDGKWELAASGSSNFIYEGFKMDNSHKLGIIRIVKDAVSALTKYTLSGVLTDSQAAKVGGATITLVDVDNPDNTTTTTSANTTGAYSFSVANGTYRLTAVKTTTNYGSVEATVNGANVTNADITQA